MPKDITDSRINLTSIARIDVATAARLSDHLLEPGDVVLSRRGDVGRSASIATTDVPVLCGTGSMRIHPGPSGDLQPGYLRYFMRSRTAIDYLEGQAVGATMPNLNAGIVSSMPIRIPPANAQSAIAHVLSSIEDLIENNRRRIDVLEQMAQAIYREWFVRFRYPGHEDATFVDSPLGPIPDGWEVVAVAKVAASKRNAVTSGPFGSKLGRKDYVNVGVPVLRGSNLSVGGGFSDDDLVFVSEEKADELRSSTATRGDVIITQRGTLGQVGLIPSDSEYETYVVSQSQMKVTVDDERIGASRNYLECVFP